MVDEVPIGKFARELAASTGLGEVIYWMLAQIGVPPNLTHLRDGLLRTKRILEAHGKEFDTCLLIIPGQRLEADRLLFAIDAALKFIDVQGWTEDDERLASIPSISGAIEHPLDGYCLSVCHHWRNLFYVLELDSEASATAEAVLANEYERLLSEVAAYLLAANSYSTPKRYFRYCAQWWKDKRRPSFPPFTDPPIYGRDESATPDLLFQRQGNAALAMYKLGCLEHRFFLKLLRTPGDPQPFHECLSQALFTPVRWDEDERDLMGRISSLIKSVRPGWRIRCTSRANSRPRGSARRKVSGGYDRLPGSDVLISEVETESGEVFEFLLLDPRDGKKAAHEREEGDEADSAEHAGGFEAAPGDAEDAETLRWMPPIDCTPDELVAFQILDADDTARTRAAGRSLRSRWAAEHLRRWHFAHGLTKDSLSNNELRLIGRAMRQHIGDKTLATLVGLLHVSLATGRPLGQARSIQLVSGPAAPGAGAISDAEVETDTTDVRYRLDLCQWELRFDPPAWVKERVTAIERPVVARLTLPDHTGFNDFLQREGLTQADFDNIRKLNKQRRTFLAQWLHEATLDTHATVPACQKALFQRLLAVSNGDVGVAGLITGTKHSHSQSVSHYAHYAVSYAQELYRLALSDFAAPAPRVPKHSAANVHRASEGIGARRVPTFAAVRRLIGKLRHAMKLARSSNELANAHNLFTAYVIVGLALGIGLRAITDPHLIDIHARIPLITFLDKARSDYHRRVSALPPLLLDQLILYAEYIRHLKTMRGLKEKSFPHAFAFMNPETGETEAFRPLHFQTLVRPYFELELYSLRRFARSTLIEDRTVAAEDLDAWMGHWFDRVSPHDQLSTYPMQRLNSFAAGPVQRLLTSLDYQAFGFNKWA